MLRLVRCPAALWLSAATLFALPLSTASTAAAQPSDSSAQNGPATDDATKQLLRQGFTALKQNDLEGARTAFQDAWARDHNFVVALSLAEVEMRLSRYRDAAEHWQFVVNNLPPSHAEQAEDARSQLERCKSRVVTVSVQLQPADATLFVDDKPIVQGPFSGELYLEPGAHELYALKDGQRSPSRNMQADAGARLAYTLSVPSGASATAAPVSPSQTTTSSDHGNEARSRSPRLPLLIAGASLAAISAGAGVYFLIERGGARSDADAAFAAAAAQRPDVPAASVCGIANRPADCNVGSTKLNDTHTYGNLAVGSFVAAGVFAAATGAVYLLVQPESGKANGSSAAVHVAPSFGSTGGGAVVFGVF